MGPYVAAPALSALAPLIVIPAITVNAGIDVWAAIAIAQSVGAAAAVCAELGWGVTGPQTAAAADTEQRSALYRQSLVSKVLPLLLVAPVAALIAWALAPTAKSVAALVALGAAGAALAQSWYFVGIGRPGLVLLTDTVPRVALTVSAAVAMALGAPVAVYAVVILVVPLISVALGLLAVRPGPVELRTAMSLTRSAWRAQRVVGAGRVFGALYTALPIALVGMVDAGAVALFSAGERLMRIGLALLNGFPARLQSWIGVAHGAERARRARRSIALSAVLGLVAGVAYTVLAPWASAVLFVGQATLPLGLAAVFGCCAALVCLSRGLGLALVAGGAANSITYATITAALVGVPAILVLSAHLGAWGGATGEVMAEAVGIVVQATVVLHGIRAGRRATRPARDSSASHDGR